LGQGVAAADDGASRPVRVKLVEGQQQLLIVDAAGTTQRLVAGPPGVITLDGTPVGSRWRTGSRAGPFRLATRPGKATFELRGQLEVHRTRAGLSVINEVSLENYVVGTLGGEMYASWEPAALQAQAVACRTYALYQMAKHLGQKFDLGADVLSQRYLGVRGESDSAWAAVRATTGVIIGYDGRPALAAFHSASGGRTASAREVWGEAIPYLKSVPVANEDDSPDTYWRVVISGQVLERALTQLGRGIGAVEDAKVVKRSASGRVGELRFRGNHGRATVTGRELRQVLGGTTIKSTVFEVRWRDGELIIAGSGNGHGVGMSQWAAQAMAEEGAGFADILGNFYPGTSLLRLEQLGRRFAKLPAQLQAEAATGNTSIGNNEMMGEKAR
jgi:stage II sporulation protein D